jgi:hypothetical protein
VGGEVIRGVILEGGRLMGVIAGEGEVGREREPAPTRRRQAKPAERAEAEAVAPPYLMLSSSVAMPGTTVVGPDGVLHINARGFAFEPGGQNSAEIRMDGEVIVAAASVAEDGTVRTTMKLAGDLLEGEHAVEVTQRAGGGGRSARSTFVMAMMDQGD